MKLNQIQSDLRPWCAHNSDIVLLWYYLFRFPSVLLNNMFLCSLTMGTCQGYYHVWFFLVTHLSNCGVGNIGSVLFYTVHFIVRSTLSRDAHCVPSSVYAFILCCNVMMGSYQCANGFMSSFSCFQQVLCWIPGVVWFDVSPTESSSAGTAQVLPTVLIFPPIGEGASYRRVSKSKSALNKILVFHVFVHLKIKMLKKLK